VSASQGDVGLLRGGGQCPAGHVEGKTVRCAGHEFDHYGRLIARCATDEGPDIGAKVVSAGLAWAFVKYSTDYRALEVVGRRIYLYCSKPSTSSLPLRRGA
jgi:Staphylococcal nuclease homologue